MSVFILKLIAILAIIAFLSLPFLPIDRFFSFCYNSYKGKYRRNNLIFVFITAIEIFVICFLFPTVINLVNAIKAMKFFEWLGNKIPDRFEYVLSVTVILTINAAFCVLMLVLKKFVRLILDKKVFTDIDFKSTSKKTSNKPNSNNGNTSKIKGSNDKKIDTLRKNSYMVFKKTRKKKSVVPFEVLTDRNDEKDIDVLTEETELIDEENFTPIQKAWFWIIGKFYRREEGYVYVKDGTYRWAKELKIFTFIISFIYLISCVFVLIPAFFSFSKISVFYKIALFIVENTFLSPVLSLIMLYEILFFINGDMKETEIAEEERFSFAFDKTEEKEIDLSEIRKVFLEKYGINYEIENFSASHSSGKNKYKYSDKKQAIKNIHNFIQKKNGFVNGGYLQGIEAMIEGNNVLFDSTIYSSLGEYIVHYLFVYLSFGNRALFICKDKNESKMMKEYLEQSICEIICSSVNFWKVSTFEDLYKGATPDILILTPDEFISSNLSACGQVFFDELVDVFVSDIEKILMSNNYYCLIMAKKLEKLTTHINYNGVDADLTVNTKKRLSYRFFSAGHIQGISGSIIQFFDLGNDPLIELHSFDMASETEVFVWHTGIDSTIYVDKGANQTPLEGVIAQEASNNGVPHINLITENPLYTSQIAELDSLHINKRYIGESPFGYVVVADDKYNLPTAIYDYTRFSGCKKSIVHVVSKPYLLREYFTHKSKEYVNRVELVGKTMLEHADYKKTQIITLLCDAVNGIERQTFIERASQLLGEEKELSLYECVKRCYELYVGDDDDCPKYSLVSGYNTNLQRKVFVILNELNEFYKKLLESTKNAVIEYQNGKNDEYIPIGVNKISQFYIAGQNIVRDNVTYTILSVDVENGILKLDNGVPTINVPGDYIQSRIYNLGDIEKKDAFTLVYRDIKSVVSKMNITAYKGNVTVDTIGYYSIENAVQKVNLAEANCSKYIVLSEDERIKIKRDIQTNILVLEMAFKGNDAAKLSYSLAAILQEFMKTMFPDDYRCISVCPVLNAEEEKALYDFNHAIGDLYPRITSFSTFPSTLECQEGEEVIRFAVLEDVEGGNGAVKTLFGGNETMITNIFHVVADYLEWSLSFEGEAKYMYFGYKQCPEMFDFEGLYNVVSQFKNNIARITCEENGEAKKCCLCQKQIYNGKGIILSDGRLICDECADTTTDTYEKLEKIFEKVMKTIKSQTTVSDTFPEDISVDFVSTEDLKKRYSPSEDGKLPYAYCNHVTKCIYVEYGISEVAVCGALAKFITSLWQDKNIVNDGSDIFYGQELYVEIQTLEDLKFKETSKTLKETYEQHKGLLDLKSAMEEANTEDSFAYFLGENGGKRKSTKPSEDDLKEKKILSIIKRDPKNLPRYHRDLLNGDEKILYQKIFDAVYGFVTTLPVSMTISYDRCYGILNYFEKDNPEVFWLKESVVFVDNEKNNAVKIEFTYLFKSEKEKDLIQKKIEKEVEPFLSGISSSMTDYEAALKTFENIVKLVDYDHIKLSQEENGLVLPKDPDNHIRSIYGVFVDKKAVCAGYARAYQYILNRLGIECTYVVGKCGEEGHAWNLIKLEDDYYYVDTTWADATSTDAKKTSHSEVKYDYFCVTTEEILKSRRISQSELYPECVATKCNYFVRNNLLFKEYDAEKMASTIIKGIKEGKKLIQIKAGSKLVYDLIQNKMLTQGYIYDIADSVGKKMSLCFCNKYLPIISFLIQ